jgi:hypothetical protein
MNTKKFSILLAAMMLIVVQLACAAGEPALTNPRTSTDSEGNSATTTFPTAGSFFAVADLSNVESGSVIDAIWYLDSAEGFDPGEIDRSSLTIDDSSLFNYVSFELVPTSTWPVGEYHVELYLNDGLAHTLAFSVR